MVIGRKGIQYASHTPRSHFSFLPPIPVLILTLLGARVEVGVVVGCGWDNSRRRLYYLTHLSFKRKIYCNVINTYMSCIKLYKITNQLGFSKIVK